MPVLQRMSRASYKPYCGSIYVFVEVSREIHGPTYCHPVTPLESSNFDIFDLLPDPACSE